LEPDGDVRVRGLAEPRAATSWRYPDSRHEAAAGFTLHVEASDMEWAVRYETVS